jgi:chromate transporter
MGAVHSWGERALKNNEWKMLLQLFWTFLKISPVTFGGGYAMIPLFEKEIVEKQRWMDRKEISDVFALSQSIPGAIGVNSATFVGYRLAGVKGAVAAMLGVLLPTFLIVILLSVVFFQVRDNAKIEAAFMGIRPAVVALIVYAAYSIGKTAMVDKTSWMTLIVALGILCILHPHPVIIILTGGVVGIILVRIKQKLGYETHIEFEKYDPAQGYMYGDGI